MGVSMGSRQSIRRPRANPLKLSGFVQFFALIILVIIFSRFDPIFIEIMIKYYLEITSIFGFFAEKKVIFSLKNQ